MEAPPQRHTDNHHEAYQVLLGIREDILKRYKDLTQLPPEIIASIVPYYTEALKYIDHSYPLFSDLVAEKMQLDLSIEDRPQPRHSKHVRYIDDDRHIQGIATSVISYTYFVELCVKEPTISARFFRSNMWAVLSNPDKRYPFFYDIFRIATEAGLCTYAFAMQHRQEYTQITGFKTDANVPILTEYQKHKDSLYVIVTMYKEYLSKVNGLGAPNDVIECIEFYSNQNVKSFDMRWIEDLGTIELRYIHASDSLQDFQLVMV
jgi:hypothetical protein